MLQQFSWGQFMIAISLLCFLWYVLVLLVFYRSELLAFFGGGKGGGFALGNGGLSALAKPSVETLKFEDKQIELEVDAALMGTSRLPDGVEVKSSSEVGFSASGSDGRYGQVGLIADVVQELKGVFAELEKKAGDKMDFFRLLERVKEEYGPLGAHPSVGALTGFIIDRAPFHLTGDEVNNLWY